MDNQERVNAMKTARNLTVLGIGLGISAAVGWLLLKESKRAKQVTRLTIRSQIRSPEPENFPSIMLPLEALEARPDTAPTADAADDLTKINDIGPRFAEALAAIGITRYAQLASQTPEVLAGRLAPHVSVRAQRIRDRDWIGQAGRLARS
jgi:predicted flap endonuclease-1-like 5' DNA nuclease